MGFKFYATKGTAEFMAENNIEAEILYWPLENKEPSTLSYIADGKIDLVINIPKNIEKLIKGIKDTLARPNINTGDPELDAVRANVEIRRYQWVLDNLGGTTVSDRHLQRRYRAETQSGSIEAKRDALPADRR